MSDTTLYDEDILLWSEQQAAVIRRLRETARGLPNELDIENVAEEIESVGRSELDAVQSCIDLVLLHLIKLILEPDAEAVPHWRAEVAGFCSRLQRRYAPSMRQRIDMDRIWRSVRRQVTLAYGKTGTASTAALPLTCPIAVDDLLEEDVDIDSLAGRLTQAGSPPLGQ